MTRWAVLCWLALTGLAAGQMPVTEVVVERVAMRELPATITLVATVEPLTRSLVASEVAGLVRTMPVRQGDAVEAGAIIARLDDDTLRLQLAEARAALMGLQATFRRWEFEVARVKGLYEDSQANDKEVYDTTAEYDRAKYSVEEQKAVVGRIESDLAKTAIRAPFTGYVVERRTEVGQWVDRGGPVVEMIDLGTVLVRVDVPESALSFVRIDDGASVKIDALKRVFDGRIRHIMRQADPVARTFPVEIEVDNADHLIAGGMFARATIASGPRKQTLAVPKDAIVVKEGIEYVGITMPDRKGGKMGMLAPVTTGSDADEWIAITSENLAPGMEVIVRGTERMFPFPSPVVIVDKFGRPVETPTEGAGSMPHGQADSQHGQGQPESSGEPGSGTAAPATDS